MMYFSHLASALLLATWLSTYADDHDDCVCYVGQEHRPGSDQPFGWTMPLMKDPCECSETRLGGLNVRPVAKPYEVLIGGNGRPVVKPRELIGATERPEKVNSQPNEPMTSVTSSTASSCVVYGTKIDPGQVPVVGMFDGYPINLHFSVTSSNGDSVELTFNDFEGKSLYKLSLRLKDKEVRLQNSKADIQFDFNGTHHFWVECLKGEVKFGKVGNSLAILTEALDISDNDVKFVSLESSGETHWAFYGDGCQ